MRRLVVTLGVLGAVVQSALAQNLTNFAAEVPEPGTALLLGAGLAGFGYLAWRRNRRK